MLNKGQKFSKGDYVKIADDLGSSMGHFSGRGKNAVIEYSYSEKYGNNNCVNHTYSVYVENQGSSSWYYENQLELIEINRPDILNKWVSEATADNELKSNLDWIFRHGREVLDNDYNASIEALARCFGLTNLWGSHGEGVTYVKNARRTLSLAHDYLINNDKNGWLDKCKEIQELANKKCLNDYVSDTNTNTEEGV